MIRILILSAILCWFFIELQIKQDPMQKLDGKVTELEQLDSDDLDFSNNFKGSDFLFFQTLPKNRLKSWVCIFGAKCSGIASSKR